MSKRYYYWIAAEDPDSGKPYLVYGGETEDDCRQKGLEMLCGINFTIHRYPTRVLSEASAYHRGKRLERGEGLKASTQRLGHERSTKRLRQRLQRRENRVSL